MIVVLKPTETHRSRAMHRLLSLVAFLVILAPLPGFSQFDENDPVFSIKKPDAAPEPLPKPAVDIRDELRPFVNVELGFIKRVCQPTPEQKQKIAAAADATIDALNNIAVLNQAEQVGGFAGGSEIVAVTANGVQLTEDPIKEIQQNMLEALRPILSAEQYAAYVDESTRRSQSKRQAVVAIAVVLIDQQLILTDQQQENLTSRLLDEWENAESLSIQMYVSNQQYFPELPDAVLQSELDAKQLAVWRSLNKTRFPLYIGTFSNDVWEEDFLE